MLLWIFFFMVGRREEQCAYTGLVGCLCVVVVSDEGNVNMVLEIAIFSSLLSLEFATLVITSDLLSDLSLFVFSDCDSSLAV